MRTFLLPLPWSPNDRTSRFALWQRKVWAATVAIFLAMLSAIANFFFIPYYPFWSILIIVLDVLVIWALAVYGGELGEGQAG